MTRDEVMAMTDEELRIKAAELTGVIKFEWHPNDTVREELRGFKEQGSEGNFITGGWNAVPDYPNDIAAAWELVASIDSSQQGVFWSRVAQIVNPSPGVERYRIYRCMPNVTPRILVQTFVMARTNKEV